MQFFQRLYEYQPEVVIAFAVALAAIVLLFGYNWLARRREECRAEEQADAEWEAKQAAYDRARAAALITFNRPTIGAPPDVKPVSRETRKVPRRKSVKRKARHK